MFMLRCVFWLSVMVASLPVGSGLIREWRGARGVVAAQAADAVVARAGTWCAAQTAQCLRDATRLTALVAAADRSDAHVEGRDDAPAVEEVAAPTRHRAARTVLTDRR